MPVPGTDSCLFGYRPLLGGNAASTGYAPHVSSAPFGAHGLKRQVGSCTGETRVHCLWVKFVHSQRLANAPEQCKHNPHFLMKLICSSCLFTWLCVSAFINASSIACIQTNPKKCARAHLSPLLCSHRAWSSRFALRHIILDKDLQKEELWKKVGISGNLNEFPK